jgi:putative metalloprotease
MKRTIPNLSDGLKTKLIFATIGVALLVFAWMLIRDRNPRVDPNYGELVLSNSTIVQKSPMPEARVKAPLSGWRLNTKIWVKNTAVYWYRMAGADEQTLKRFALPDDRRKAQMVSDCSQVIKNSDCAQTVLAPTHPLSKRVSALVSPHRAELGIPLSVKIYDSPEKNAVSSPDGSIRFYRGILERLTDDEIRALFGHELGHIVMAHKEGQNAWDTNMQLFLFKLSDKTRSKITTPVKNFVSKDHELKADDFSFNWAKYHGYDLLSHYTVFGKLADIQTMPGYPTMDER